MAQKNVWTLDVKYFFGVANDLFKPFSAPNHFSFKS